MQKQTQLTLLLLAESDLLAAVWGFENYIQSHWLHSHALTARAHTDKEDPWQACFFLSNWALDSSFVHTHQIADIKSALEP